MQNWFATFALVTWPLVAIVLFSTQKLNRAIIWTVLAAQLLLPVGANIKFSMVPQFDKTAIPNFCILIGCLLAGRRALRFFHGFGIVEVLILMNLAGPILTSQFNGDQLAFGDLVLPGVGLYDALSAAELAFILLIPFFIGRQFLSRENDIKEIFRILVSAELIYSLLLLFEVRFSPQLHNWLYGYQPSEFIQSIRDGAFRPMAFMGHGLLAAQFLMMAIVASAALWRARIPTFGLPAGIATGYLSVVLILSKSLGATVYTAVLTPVVRWAKPRFQVRIAIALVIVSMLYPLSRSLDIFPTDILVDAANTVSADRAESLQFRFDNETRLLARAFERPIFGWGRFGRARIYDSESGKDLSVTDGRWIITLGQFGLFGFIGEFGLLAMSVFRAASALRFAKNTTDKTFLAALSLMVAVNILDLLPNSGLVPWTWLLCGALLGRAELLLRARHTPNSLNLQTSSKLDPAQHESSITNKSRPA